MSVVVPVGRSERSEKMRLVKIEQVPASQVPFRVVKRSNGLVLAMCTTKEEADNAINKMSLETLRKKPTRKSHR